jgi:site-specific DNA recombinase
MVRAGVYARISDDRAGAGLGVERQIEDCLRLASGRGWTVVERYVDNDVSAYRGKARPRFADLLADIEAGHLDAVVAYHQDRLTRTPTEFETFLAACDAARLTKFTTVTGFTELGQGDGVMVARIFAAVAAGESDAKSRRVRRKNDQRAAQGLPHLSGQRPFGYERDGMTVREDEAVVIRAAAERFLAGESLTSIAGWMAAQGVRTATGVNEWRTPTLRNLLKSPRIAGLREHRGEVVGPGAWPGIITEAQHHQITTKLNDPTRRTVRTPRRYVLSGLVRCSLCEAKMVSAPDSGRRRYGCRSGHDFGGCGKVYISGDALDRFVADVVLLRLDTPEMAAALAVPGRHVGDSRATGGRPPSALWRRAVL